MARCKGIFRRGLHRLRQGLYPVPRRDWEVRHQAVVREAHKQYSETINKVMLILLSVSFFCLLTIYGSPDSVLLKADSTIKIPFTDTQMSFFGFSIVVPFLLLVLTAYLHIFFSYWLDYERERKLINQRLVRTNEPPIEGIPTLFSLPDSVSSMLRGFVLYGLMPLVFVSLTWKAAARSDITLSLLLNLALPLFLMYVTGVVTGFLVFLLLRRCSAYPRFRKTPISCVSFLLIIGVMVVITCRRDCFFPRRLALVHAELADTLLSGKDMRDAHAKGANLQEALLEHACLERADLSGANLNGARLWNACLASAQLPQANLVNALLPGADLTNANLTNANLTNADLSSGAYLTGACLIGATLKGTNLTGANLQSAILPRDLRNIRLSKADLTGSTLTSTGACLPDANRKRTRLPHDLTGTTEPRRDACLPGTNPKSDSFPADFQNAHRIETDLSGATLAGADLTSADLTDATLTGVDLMGAAMWKAHLMGANLTRAKPTRADLTLANLTGANLWNAHLTNAHLTRADLTRAHLRGADLTGADLTHALLPGADLWKADLTHADLTHALLPGADLTDATLTGATLTDATLTRANLTGATLTRANLTRANLTRANLTGANLETVTDLTQAQVDKACGDKTTKLPKDLTGPDQCLSASLLWP